jgi:catechol 2,3-dioxygenase-like lactoylglutathione lyase family enzyme
MLSTGIRDFQEAIAPIFHAYRGMLTDDRHILLARYQVAGEAMKVVRSARTKPTSLVTGSNEMILNPDHVTIAVADAGPAIDFFELLGFKEAHVATIDGGLPARYMGMPAMKAQHITLALAGANPPFEIQLLEFEPAPGSDPGAHPTNLRQRGFNHLAFRVDDIEATTAHLVANGVTMLNDEMDYISRKLRFFEGPEGITFELVQRDG